MLINTFAVQATDGNYIYPDYVAAHQYTYDASGNVLTDTFVDFNGFTYILNMTWTNGLLTNTGQWVKQ